MQSKDLAAGLGAPVNPVMTHESLEKLTLLVGNRSLNNNDQRSEIRKWIFSLSFPLSLSLSLILSHIFNSSFPLAA